MTDAVACDFRTAIAQRIEVASPDLASRWLEHVTQLVALGPDEIFPGDRPLDHAHTVIREVGAYLHLPKHDSIAANAVVTARATELGHLRHAQRASVHQILREYRALRTVIIEFVEKEIGRFQAAPRAGELLDFINRLDAAVEVLLKTTLDTFVTEYTETITEHTERLEEFSRMVTHELRQPLGTFQFAVKLLGADDTWSDRQKRDRVLASAERSVTRMTETLGKLVALSQSADAAASGFVQRVELSAITADVFAQLREMAEARGVELRMTPPLPAVRVDLARLELILVNLISNAIKYSDPEKTARVVEIAPAPNDRAGFSTVGIRDNGIGIAESDLRSIFGRFYRGRAAARDPERHTAGLGLGLSIVADCVDALKGDIRVESKPGEGTTFLVELPAAPGA